MSLDPRIVGDDPGKGDGHLSGQPRVLGRENARDVTRGAWCGR